MTTWAQRERQLLCDLFESAGDASPTLCEGWVTRDLAAHLVLRERRPDAAPGIIVHLPVMSRYSEKVHQRIAAQPWPDLIRTVRDGPPAWSPTKLGPVDELANAVEFFVHHEDVRRARPGVAPRALDPGFEDLLRARVRHCRLLVRRCDVGLVLRDVDDTVLLTHRPGADRQVIVTGPPSELLLYVHGRQAHAEVQQSGEPLAVAAVQHARFGL